MPGTLSVLEALEYIASYADLSSAFGTDTAAGTEHYALFGMAEGRVISFSSLDYLAAHADLLAVFGNDPATATAHYIEHGRGEGRGTDFNGLAYIASHDDLIAVFGTDEAAGTRHYVENGYGEGRDPTLFDALQYAAGYADIAQAFGADQVAATRHFIENGFTEGRARDAFDAAQYLANYADLQAAFGSDQQAATLHYLTYGVHEGRTDEGGSNQPPSGASLTQTVSSLPESTDTSAPIKVATFIFFDDGLGTNTVTLSGADASLFERIGDDIYIRAGASLNAATNPSLDLTITVDDPTVGSSPDILAQLQSISITPTPPQSEGETPTFLTGTPVFETSVIDTDVVNAHITRGGDLDGDGNVDLIATNFEQDSDGEGQVLLYTQTGTQNGTPTFSTSELDFLPDAYPASIADVDKDGDLDVLAAGYNAHKIVWYINNGSGSFTERNIDTTTQGPHSIFATDLDGDGDNDLLATHQINNSVGWYENNGSNSFSGLKMIDEVADDAKEAKAADIDGDGDLDVVASSYWDNRVVWHRNGDSNGNGTGDSWSESVIDSHTSGAIPGPYHLDLGDLDGDGDVDVVSAHRHTDSFVWYRNDGNGGSWTEITLANRDLTTAAPYGNSFQGARSVHIVDIDNDGDADILGASKIDQKFLLFLNDGNENFSVQRFADTLNGPYGVDAIDVDNDGLIDILGAANDSNTASVHYQSRAHFTSVSPGGERTITSSMLRVIDNESSAANITYTITDAPNAGMIERDGLPIGPGGTFTQAEIDAGRIKYDHSSGTADDRFDFTVSDNSANTNPARGYFTIDIAGGAALEGGSGFADDTGWTSDIPAPPQEPAYEALTDDFGFV